MKARNAFTMIELIFVIVVMGIIGKFGVEFLAQAYKSFIFSSVNNTLQSNSATTLEFIASRLQYRIKDSVIARTGLNTSFEAIGDVDTAKSYKVLEWIASDIDGFRASSKANWSGIIDIRNTNATQTLLVSPETNTTAIDELIKILSYTYSDINHAALYFIGSNNNINEYSWNGNATTDQSQNMHPIKTDADITHFLPRQGGTNTLNTFAGVDIYEYYKLSWTANAIVFEEHSDYATSSTGDLVFYFNYQPWDGEKFYDTGKNIQKVTIMENISTFRFLAIGSIIKIQVCAKSTVVEEYSLCKEKTIF